MSKSMHEVELLRAACCVAGADGETSPDERQFLERVASRAGVGGASLDAMIECAEQDEEFYKAQFRVVAAEPQRTMDFLFKVAAKDGRLSRSEARMLKRLSQPLGVSATSFDKWLKSRIEKATSR
ncbi:MAG: TerB family tellurite resistance protein [Planctomycetota bacterium]|jgi:tellurite resistance protein